jgi:hypothetical protein
MTPGLPACLIESISEGLKKGLTESYSEILTETHTENPQKVTQPVPSNQLSFKIKYAANPTFRGSQCQKPRSFY